jgi:GDP-L-fucose synthase
MKKKDKIFVAGHRGLVGSAIVRLLKVRGFHNLILKTHQELDLSNQIKTELFFQREKPEYVILAAAKVGGINANNTYPASFIYENIMIQSNTINSSYNHGVKRLLLLGSSCIYPKECEQPITEESLLTGKLEPTNEPYALSKITGLKLCESYNRQYGTDFRCVMPTNLYGINDNFHPYNSHVIPALIKRFHQAIVFGDSQVVIWGTGKPVRDFLYVDDMAEASLFVMNLDEKTYTKNTQPMQSHINIGTGIGVSINELAEMIRDITGYEGKIVFDHDKPDGSMKKIIDVKRLSKMGWRYKTELRDGLVQTYNFFLKNNV